jgi:hypothetical protein
VESGAAHFVLGLEEIHPLCQRLGFSGRTKKKARRISGEPLNFFLQGRMIMRGCGA